MSEVKSGPNRSANRSTNLATSRRDLLKGAAAAGVGFCGFWVGGRGAWADPGRAATGPTTSPNERLNLGIIGVAGRASGNLHEEGDAVAGQNLVALCDVDENRLNDVAGKFPKAAKYRDFRKLLDRNDLDAVVVSTPDHTHAAATLMALSPAGTSTARSRWPTPSRKSGG